MTSVGLSGAQPFWYWTEKEPVISARDLGAMMVASDRERQAILRRCKFPSSMPDVSFGEAKFEICSFLSGACDMSELAARSRFIRHRKAQDGFDYVRNGFNADCIDDFLIAIETVSLPRCRPSVILDTLPIYVDGLKITVDVPVRLSRTTRSNKPCIGAMSFHYAPDFQLNADAAEWHAAFIHGYLRQTKADNAIEVNPKLCAVLDIHSGKLWTGPTNSVTRYSEIRKICASIAELWPSIEPADPVRDSPLYDSDDQYGHQISAAMAPAL